MEVLFENHLYMLKDTVAFKTTELFPLSFSMCYQTTSKSKKSCSSSGFVLIEWVLMFKLLGLGCKIFVPINS